MKIIVTKLPALAGVLCLLAAASARAQNNKIATIDLQKAFNKYYQYDVMRKALAHESDDIESDHKNMMNDHTKAVEEFNKLKDSVGDRGISEDEKKARQAKVEAKAKDIRAMENDIRNFEERAQSQLETDQQRTMKKLLDDIRNAVNAKAKDAGYAMVIDSSAQIPNVASTPVVLYTSGVNDITDDIIKQLNAGAPPPSAAPDSTTPSASLDPKKK